MTTRDVIQAMRKRWYVVLAALLCAGGLTAAMYVNSGLYSTRTIVQFTQLGATQGPLGLNTDLENDNFIAFAGAVASEVNNGRPVSRYAWESAPLYGAGVRQGVLVALPDAGGQWMTSFTRAQIEIQVVGPTEEWVETRQQELVQKVFASVRSLQGPVYNSRQSIRATVVPLTTNIEFVKPSKMQLIAACLSVLAAALFAGGWAAARLELSRSKRTRTKRSDAAEEELLNNVDLVRSASAQMGTS